MKNLDLILDRCIDDLARGATVGECLERYPELREELEPLLETAASLHGLPRPEPSGSAMRTVLVRAGAALAVQEGAGEAEQTRAPSRGQVLRFPLRRPVLRIAAGLAAVVILAVLGGASADTVPGDLLYPLKLAREKVTFGLTVKPDHRAELRLTFADRRLEELVKMADSEGKIDPELVRRLLEEGALALQDARPLPEDRLEIFLKKLEHFTQYQKTVLEQISPRVPDSQRPVIREAIDMCGERARWMRRAKPEKVRSLREGTGSCWGWRCD